jgi:energy-coupling factor transport system ATP-binding protein
VVVAEHRLHVPLPDASRLVVLDRGQVVRDGSPGEVVSQDLGGLPLDLPFVVQLAQAAHWNPIPLSVGQALPLAPGSLEANLLERRNGARPVENAPAVIQVRNVSFEQDGQPVLRNVSFDLHRGESVALIGKNGSGKTTLLKHLNGLLRPTAGSVTVLGRDTRRAKVSELAGQVALVFQNPNDQLFKPNVREEIEVAPRALDRFDPDWLDRLVEKFALSPFLDRSPFLLSEGEKKRVAFAAALAAKPQVLVLDEPTTGQDVSFRMALAGFVHDLQAQGFAIILATHDLEFAEQVSARWIALAEGEIVADGSPEAVMASDAAMARAALRPTARFLLRRALEREIAAA